MSTAETLPPNPDDRLDAIIEGYLRALEAGSAPDPQELLDQYPDLAPQLREFFASRDVIEKQAGAVRDAIGKPATLVVGARVRYFGDYELLSEIARGGMGVVFKARQARLNRTVAVKMILSGQLAGKDDVQRFYTEAQSAANLQHPNIVAIHEVGEHAGQHYFSMDYVEGRSLAEIVRENPLPARQAARYVSIIADAIHYAHQKGTLHRDLKPSNVLIDGADQPRVTDFGLAKQLGASAGPTPGSGEAQTAAPALTATGAALGTPSYMPPEQAAGRRGEIGPASDAYSLGAILYELLTGRPPFRAETPLETLLQVLEAEPAAPRLLNPSVPSDLETICLKCLEKEPRSRYMSAAELADDLRRFLNDEPIRARPVGQIEHTWRWLRKRHRSVLVAIVASAAAVAIVVGSLVGWQLYQQSQLGRLVLKTDRVLMTGELLDEKDELVVPAFTVPTREPLSLPSGEYKLRVSGSGALSRTYRIDIEPGEVHTFRMALGDAEMIPPVAVPSPTAFEIARFSSLHAPREVSQQPDNVEKNSRPSEAGARRDSSSADAATDIVVLPKSPDTAIVKRISPATGKTVWEANWKVDSPDIADLVKTDDDRAAWQGVLCWWDSWWYLHSTPAKLVTGEPSPPQPNTGMKKNPPLPPLSTGGDTTLDDLDGDGVGDLVWSAPVVPWNMAMPSELRSPARPASLLAVSGATGKPLWWCRALDSEGRPGAIIQGAAIHVAAPSKRGETKSTARYVGVFLWAHETWLECLDGATGQSVWRYKFPHPWQFDMNAGPVAAPMLCTVGGRSVIVSVVGPKVIGVDAETGKPAWTDIDMNWEQWRHFTRPRLADLDGDGQDELLLATGGGSSRWPGGTVKFSVVSLSSGRTQWSKEIVDDFASGVNSQPAKTMTWPYVADIDNDGKNEVVVLPRYDAEFDGYYEVQVLDGGTGMPRWTRRFPIEGARVYNQSRPQSAVSAGPDVDGDDLPELFLVSAWSDDSHDADGWSGLELYIDCLSGRDGHTLWWSSTQLGKPDVMNHPLRRLGPLQWTDSGADGWPQLLVPLRHQFDWGGGDTMFRLLSVSARTGQIERMGADLGEPLLADFNGDGLNELAVYVPDDPSKLLGASQVQNIDLKGHLKILRGLPSLAWERPELWEPLADLDGDGSPELTRPGEISGEFNTAIVSGCDGRFTTRLDFQWSGQHRQDRFARWKTSLPLPLGDLDGDGMAEIFLTDRSWTGLDPVNILNAVPMRLQALSGRTGRPLWTEPTVEVGTWTEQRGETTPEALFGVDVDGDGKGEVLCHYKWEGRDPQAGQELWDERLALIDGRTGAVRWCQLCRERAVVGWSWMVPTRSRLNAAQAGDLDGDKKPELLVVVAHESAGVWGSEIQARRGIDGELLWRAALFRQGFKGQAGDANLLVTPQVADLDGDGALEVLAIDLLAKDSTIFALRVLNGRDGKPAWVSEMHDLRNRIDQIHLVAADVGPGGKRAVCLALYDSGESPKLVLLDAGDVLLGSRQIQTPQCWSHDLDGDGKLELLFIADGKLQAVRGGLDTVLWEWPLEGSGTTSLEFQGERKEMIVVVQHGNDVLALRGSSGECLRRGWNDGGVDLPPSIPLLAAKTNGTSDARNSQSMLQVVSHIAIGQVQQTRSRLWLPTHSEGKFVVPPLGGTELQAARLKAELRTDLRFVRRLPWMAGIEDDESAPGWFAGIFATMVVLSLAMYVLPGWLLIRAVRSRNFSVTWLLGLAASFGLAIAVFKIVAGIPYTLPPDIPLILQLIVTVAGLPAGAFVLLLFRWTWQRRWRAATMLLAVSVAAAIIIAAVAISENMLNHGPAQHYSSTGWYHIYFIGAYLTGLAALAMIFLLAILRSVRKLFRKKAAAQPA